MSFTFSENNSAVISISKHVRRVWSISKLFAGAIVHIKEIIVIVPCKSYSRYTSINTHAETNKKRLPVYPSISYSSLKDANGHTMKQEPIIEMDTINIFSTCSTTISHSSSINIGP